MKKIFLIASIVASFFIGSFGAHASDIRIVTNKTIVSAGETVSATVYIDSPTESINNAEGTISFPKGLITANSINFAGSIFSMWVEQPSFSNSAGTITFNGGIPNPGYKGSSGKVFDISFTVQKAGTIELTFSSVALRLNDGSGTNVVSKKTDAVLNPVAVPVTTPTPTPTPTPIPTQTPPVNTPAVTTPPKAVGQVPQAPVIFSQDMPNEDEWYNFSGTTFSWVVPDDVLSTQLFLGSFPDSIPSVTYTPAIKSKYIPTLSEGVWYLHARFRNQAGWGKITHRKILVDSSAPTDISATYTTNEKGNLVLTMSGKDAYSGIAKYIIDLSSRKLMEVEASTSTDFATPVTLPALTPGEHNIVVTAYDHVGNVSSASVKIVAPNLAAPEITSYPEKINKGEVFTVGGQSHYADTDLIVYVQEADMETKKFLVKSSPSGDFEFTSAIQSNDGVVTVYAKNVITDGSSFESDASQKVHVLVEKSQFIKISSKLTSLLSLIVPIVALVMLLVWLVYIAIRHVARMKKKTRRTYSTDDGVHNVFGVLKDDVRKYLAIKSRPSAQNRLNLEEKAALKDLADDLEKSEEYFRKKFESIKREKR